MQPRASSIAGLAGRALSASLQACTSTGAASCQWSNADSFARTLGGFHETYACLNLDIVAHENLLLERIRPRASSAAKRTLLASKG
jgi:hypothetical protein